MTPDEREALVSAMRRAFADADGCGQAAMRAALAVAEPVVREDERMKCISSLREMASYEADETASKAMTGAAFVLELTRARGAA